ncbi:hypothetical protein, partial [Pseudomonas syringae]|uniref:hypothetical protein n=1 Tax=Pseudomonas syringae TaxID=317 RepID=UPI001956B30E
CDAERRELHSHWSVRNDRLNIDYRADAPRRYAVLDAPRPLLTQSVLNCIPTLEREEREAPGYHRNEPF